MPESPNVLVVLTDQWRAEVLGCMGDDQVQTPRLDQFAESGLTFELVSRTSTMARYRCR